MWFSDDPSGQSGFQAGGGGDGGGMGGFDPASLQALLAMFASNPGLQGTGVPGQMQFASGDTAGAAQTLAAGFGGSGGGGGGMGALGMLGGGAGSLGEMLGGLAIGDSPAAQEGGQWGSLAGGTIGSLFGPLGSLIGSFGGGFLGDVLGGWIGGGLPKMAKPQAFASALSASGNPLEQLLGRYAQGGVNRGYTLSESSPAPFNPARFADVLSYLGNQRFPLQGGYLAPFGGNLGFQNQVKLGGIKELDALKQLMGPTGQQNILSLGQLNQIYPELAALTNRYASRGNLRNLLGQENILAGKLKAAESY